MFSVYHGLIVASNHYLTLPMLQKCRLLWICRQLHIKISSIRSKFRRNVDWVANSLIKTRRRVTQRLVWFQAVCKGLLNVNSRRRVKHNWYKIRLYLCFINVSAWSFLWKTISGHENHKDCVWELYVPLRWMPLPVLLSPTCYPF